MSRRWLIELIGSVWLIALIGLASCSNEGSEVTPQPPVPEPTEPQTPISFSGGLQDEQSVTRAATTPLKDHATTFTVFGFKNTEYDDKGTPDTADDEYTAYQQVFPGYTVRWIENSAGTTTTNSSNWEYVNQQNLGKTTQTIKYWDWNAKAYRFFGVAGATKTNEVTGEEETIGGIKYYKVTYKSDATNEEDTPYYSHLWFSTGKLPEYNDRQFGKPVVLQFIKPLSKVRFLFIFEEPEKARETELTEKSFRPTNGTTIKMKGDVTVTYPLTGTGVTEVFASTAGAEGITALELDYYETTATGDVNGETKVIEPYLNADATKTNQVYTVLPVTGQSSYTLTVRVNGEPKSTVVPATFMDWKPGYQYTYIFKVHADNGVEISSVQSAFMPWDNYNTNHTVYNW